MGHKTLIGGTAYEISGGKTLVDGTAYGISGGKTLIGGTAYDVSFARDPITIFAKGDTALQYGSWAETGLHGGYRINAAIGLLIEYAEEVWDDQAEDYVTTNMPNLAAIEVNASGYSKLIINAKLYNKYDKAGKVGWGTSPSSSAMSSATLTMPGYSAAADYEFDISGQGVIYILMYSEDYSVYIYNIRLE